MLLGAAALVIGTVIAVSNHTLPRLPREHPRKARSVPAEGDGEARSHGSCSAHCTGGKLRHGDAAVPES